MERTKPRAEDIHYEYNTRGYMMYYKGQPIGGGGIDKHAKGCRSNLKLFREYAESTKRSLVAGIGSKYMMDEIAAIDMREIGAMS